MKNDGEIKESEIEREKKKEKKLLINKFIINVKTS